MGRNEDIALAIRQRDIEAISRLMFERSPPVPRASFRTETELWDYKAKCPERLKPFAAKVANVSAHRTLRYFTPVRDHAPTNILPDFRILVAPRICLGTPFLAVTLQALEHQTDRTRRQVMKTFAMTVALV